jgi:S-adenosylmethionine decarboxylase
MLFEGSEKKLEVVFSKKSESLFSKSEAFWQELVHKAKAKILSSVSNSNVQAYLLSESSLFIWENRLTLITCGQTTLIEAAKFILQHFKSAEIESLIFQRKNEYFPHHQPSDFFQDSSELNQYFDGRSYRFGKADEHHLFVYHLAKNFDPDPKDRTLEVLMYDLAPEVLKLFQDGQLRAEELRRSSGLDEFFMDWKIDDHIFHPYGYSLNALNENKYATIHVTPQEEGCYVSFETNNKISAQKNEIGITMGKILDIFQPKSFDVVYFDPTSSLSCEAPGFIRKNFVEGLLSCGYQVSFANFYLPENATGKPVELRGF